MSPASRSPDTGDWLPGQSIGRNHLSRRSEHAGLGPVGGWHDPGHVHHPARDSHVMRWTLWYEITTKGCSSEIDEYLAGTMKFYITRVDKIQINLPQRAAYMGQIDGPPLEQAMISVNIDGRAIIQGSSIPVVVNFPRENSPNHPQMVNLSIALSDLQLRRPPSHFTEIVLEI